jgi:putative DNA primase/helicase
VDDIVQKCVGRWPAILSYFGMANNFLTGKHGPCPCCGGKDRFRFDDQGGRGTYFCSSCGAGDGFQLLQKYTGETFKSLLPDVKSIVCDMPSVPVEEKKTASLDYIRKVTRKTLEECHDIDKMDYLSSRGITKRPNVKFHDGLGFYQDGKEIGKFPAMVGTIVDSEGKGVAIHRTYLAKKDGVIRNSKKLMPGVAPFENVAIRLYPHDEVLGVAEGIETACSAMEIFDVPTWACINTKIMETFIPPQNVKHLIIFGDNDGKFGGQYSAYKLAAAATKMSWIEEVEVRIPATVGDWNDVLNNTRSVE